MRRTRTTVVVVLAALIGSTLGTALAAVTRGVGRPDDRAAVAAEPVLRGMEQLAAATPSKDGQLLGIATFGGTRPSPSRLGALKALGLEVQGFRKLPLALVYGTRAELTSAVTGRVARDVYPNARLQQYSAASTAAMRAGPGDHLGATGKGVGVAVVDTGVDATHPDLSDHVAHNMKLVGPEYLNLVGIKAPPDLGPGTLVVATDQLPYNNSDTSGHGTHVAGIIAADGHTSPDQVGVAPDATLVAYGTGDAIFIFTVLAAFDDILVRQNEWGIRVVNNSWGDHPRLFDANHPINVATKVLHDAGITMVFAAGNDGEQFQMNPYSLAPWVISVGSATVSRGLSSFSSGGLEYDNSTPVALPADRHLRFDGDRVGLYHPDVSAPGSDITSSGTPTGVSLLSGGGGPTLPGGTTTLSGTSMAAPHIAGLAAVLLEVRPTLTPDQIRQVLQVSSLAMSGDAPFWHAGFGFADGTAAVDLVRRADFSQALLDRLEGEANQKVLAARPFRVRSADFWGFTAAPASVGGTDTRRFTLPVDAATKAVSAVVSYPSTSLVGVNLFDWQITLSDAGGRVVASSSPSSSAGVSSLFADLTRLDGLRFGVWTVQVAGVLAASDPDIQLGDAVSLAVSQLEPQPRPAPGTPGAAPTFRPAGSVSMFFAPAGPAGLLPSLEGCETQDNPPTGELAMGQPTVPCRAATVGWAVTHALETPAEFTSAPLPGTGLTVGGPAQLTLYLSDPVAAAYKGVLASLIQYDLSAVTPDGAVVPVAAGHMDREAEADLAAVKGQYGFTVPPTTLPAGSRLRLQLRFSGVYASGLRMLYGLGYADSGLTLTTGQFATD